MAHEPTGVAMYDTRTPSGDTKSMGLSRTSAVAAVTAMLPPFFTTTTPQTEESTAVDFIAFG